MTLPKILESDFGPFYILICNVYFAFSTMAISAQYEIHICCTSAVAATTTGRLDNADLFYICVCTEACFVASYNGFIGRCHA